jgi:uncharacterized protein HemX
MSYVLAALVVLLLAAGLGLAVWVSKLKDQVQHWLVLHAQAVNRFTQEKRRAEEYLAQRRRLEEQLRVLREDHEEFVQKVESGALCDAGSIAAELRRVRSDNA